MGAFAASRYLIQFTEIEERPLLNIVDSGRLLWIVYMPPGQIIEVTHQRAAEMLESNEPANFIIIRQGLIW